MRNRKFRIALFAVVMSFAGQEALAFVQVDIRKDKPVAKAVESVAGKAKSLLPPGKEWKLVWHDEFDQKEIDKTKWMCRESFWGHDFPAFAHNFEGVEMTGETVKLNLFCKDGQFSSPHLQTGSLTYDVPKDTKGFWPFGAYRKPLFMHRYGYYEIRCKQPKHPGWHSAFWLQAPGVGSSSDPSVAGVETDIMENYRQFVDGKIVGGNGWNGYGKDSCWFGHFAWDYEAYEDGWCYYGVDWSPKGYTFYANGKKVGEQNDPVSHVPQFILVSTEPRGYRNPGSDGGLTAGQLTWGKPDPRLFDVPLPDTFEVDFVRVYDAVEPVDVSMKETLSGTTRQGIRQVSETHIPFCALRAGSGLVQAEHWPKALEALAANPNAFDEVWFSTGISYPTLAWHEEQSRRCAGAAADLRKLGIAASVEIQATIGHGDGGFGKYDYSALDWQTWVGWDGTAAKVCSCPRAPGLRAYFRRVAAIYAAWHPDCLWIDDDLRLNNRAPCTAKPNRAGCWCASCLSEFSKSEGKVWTRETLLAAIAGGETALEARWMSFQTAGLAELARDIAAEVTRISPGTRLGSEFGCGVPEVIRALRDGSGKPVRIRPGAGAYWDTNPHQQIAKAYYASWSTAQLGCCDMIEAVIPEIETCPRTFSCRTPQGVVLEAFEHLACGADALSLYVADTRAGEDWNYYRDVLFRRLAAAHGFLLGYRQANEGTLPCGFTVEDGPQDLVACRGVPVVTGRCRDLGRLPDVGTIPTRTGGAIWQARGLHPDTLTMQTAAGPDLMAFAKRADESCGNRTPVMFGAPVMAWAVPHVRPDGALRTVAIVNASIDMQKPVRVRLRGVPEGATVEWRPLHGEPSVLGQVRDGAEVSVELPAIPAWDCGYLLVEGRREQSPVDAPFVILRSYGTYEANRSYTERVFAAQERHPGLVDEIWFCGCGDPFSTPAEMGRAAEKGNLAAKERCRRLGIRFSYQDGVTLNHGPDGIRRAGIPEDAWAVDREGKVVYGVFCCTSPFAKDFCREKAKAIMSALRPASYWPDDDLRMSKAGKPPAICFCNRCLGLFGARRGRIYDRKGLLSELTGPEASAETRRAWCAFNGECLGAFAKVYREAADAVSPETTVRQQLTVSETAVNGDGWRTILEAHAAGGHATGVRPGGGYYSDQEPFALVGKMIDVAKTAARVTRLPCVKQVCYEAETWPHIGALKSPGGLMAECAYALAAGCDSLALYWGSDINGETSESYDFFFDTLAAWKPFLVVERQAFRGTTPGGLAQFVGIGRFADDAWTRTTDIWDAAPLARNGLPLADDEGTPDAFFFNARSVRTLTQGDLATAFAKPVLMDVKTFAALVARFPDLAFAKKVRITEPPAEKAAATSWRPAGFERFAGGQCDAIKGFVRPLSPDVVRMSEMTADPAACGTCVIPTEFGGSVVLVQDLAFQSYPWAGPQMSWAGCRRHGVLDALDRAVPGKLPVRLLTDGYACVVVARKTPDGRTAGAFVMNFGTGETPPLKLALRRTAVRDWTVLGPRGRVDAPGAADGDETVVTLPPLPAFGVAVVVPDQQTK